MTVLASQHLICATEILRVSSTAWSAVLNRSIVFSEKTRPSRPPSGPCANELRNGNIIAIFNGLLFSMAIFQSTMFNGKLTIFHGKSPLSMEESTISMAIFKSKLFNYQRVWEWGCSEMYPPNSCLVLAADVCVTLSHLS